jgi:hypothetical protein
LFCLTVLKTSTRLFAALPPEKTTMPFDLERSMLRLALLGEEEQRTMTYEGKNAITNYRMETWDIYMVVLDRVSPSNNMVRCSFRAKISRGRKES